MAGNLSRRGFMRLATDSLIALPTVMGGFLAVTPVQALALTSPYDTEPDGGAHSGAVAEVIVVRPWEVGFMVVDMADAGQSRVPGAQVTVTSRYNQQSVSGTTDDKGVVVLDVSKLSIRPDDGSEPKVFYFNGAVKVSAGAGYRDFATKLMHIMGGGGLLVPSRKLQDNKPYPVSASFDEWDILYTIESYSTGDKTSQTDPGDGYVTFNASVDNPDVHTLEVELANLTPSKQVTVQFCERKGSKKILETTATSDGSGRAVASFAKAFLKSDGPDVLPMDTDFDIHFVYDGAGYDFPIKLRAHKTVFDSPKTAEFSGNKNKRIKPLMNVTNSTSDKSGFGMKLPSIFPLGAGDMFSVWMPEFPVNVYADPGGYFQLSARTPSWGYVSDSGKPDQDGWKKTPRKAVTDQIKDLEKKWDSGMKSLSNVLNDRGGFADTLDYSRKFSAQAYLRFLVVAQWSDKDNYFTGNAAGQVVFSISYSYTQPFMAGPIPAFIQFDFNSSVVVSLGPGLVVRPKEKQGLWDAICDFDNYEWDYTNSGLTFTVCFSPALSVGVGISGVLAASLRGSFSITAFVGITGHTAQQKLPHVIVGYDYKADVVLQFFLFTYKGNLFKGGDDAWYDNWKGLYGQSDNAQLQPQAEGASFDDFKPVTDAMLQTSLEFEDNRPLTAQEELEGKPQIVFESVMDESSVMEDGTVLPRMIYTLKVLGEDEALQAQAEASPAQDAPAEAAPSEEPTQEETAAAEPQAVEDGALMEAAAVEAVLSSMAEPGAEAAVAATPSEADTLLGAELLSQEEDGLEAPDVLDESASEDISDDLDAGSGEDAGQQDELSDESSASEDAGQQDGATSQEQDGMADESSVSEDGEDVSASSPLATPIPGDWVPVERDDGSSEADLVAMTDSTPGISGIGDHGGLNVDGEAILASNVFGNPLVQVLEIGGTVYALRIGTAKVKGTYLTRIIATTVSGRRSAGRKSVLSFQPTATFDGPKREELCDYEFAAKVQGDFLHIAVISGRRNVNSLPSSATDLVLSYMLLHHNAINGFDRQQYCVSWTGAKVFGEDAQYPYHSLSSLNLQVYERPQSNTNMRDVAAISYLDRRAKSAEATLSQTDASVTVGLIFAWAIDFGKVTNNLQTAVIDPSVIASKLVDVDPTTFELVMTSDLLETYTLTLRGSKKNQLYILRRTQAVAKETQDGSGHIKWEEITPSLQSIKHMKDLDPSERLHPWRIAWQHNMFSDIGTQEFLYCGKDDGQLYAARVEDYYNNFAQFKNWGTGPQGFSSYFFGVLGEIIYWPEMRNGVPGHEYDEEMQALKPENEIFECHLMAARVRNGSFSDSFIMAEMDHCIDAIKAVSALSDKMALSVVCSELTDEENNRATIYYLRVPLARVVTATAAMAVNPFVAPGKPAGFYITFQNNGNTFLQACEIVIYDKANIAAGPAATSRAVFSMDTLQESAWNPRGADEKLQKCEPDGVLAPGKTGVYLAEITIPENWSGRKDVVFVAQNGEMISGMTAQAEDEDAGEDEALEYHVAPEDVSMEVVFVENSYWQVPRLSDAPVTVDDDTSGGGSVPSDGGTSGDSGTSGGGGTSGGSSGSGVTSGGSSGSGSTARKTLPQTGDAGTAVAAGIAAAGTAALVAAAMTHDQEAESEQ